MIIIRNPQDSIGLFWASKDITLSDSIAKYLSPWSAFQQKAL